MAKYAIFVLGMPNSGSWNGQWSGRGNRYAVCLPLTKKEANSPNIKDGAYHYYNFGDGWGASVTVNIVEGIKAKREAMAGVTGFYGYEWMVKSIVKHGKIYSDWDKREVVSG